LARKNNKKRLEVWTRTLHFPSREELKTFKNSEFYNDFCIPQRFEDAAGLTFEPGVGMGTAGVYLQRSTYGAERFSDFGATLLSVLLPAFKTGVTGWLRIGRQGEAFWKVDRRGFTGCSHHHVRRRHCARECPSAPHTRAGARASTPC